MIVMISNVDSVDIRSSRPLKDEVCLDVVVTLSFRRITQPASAEKLAALTGNSFGSRPES